MQEPITANYVTDGEDWTVTVAAGEQQHTAKAAGLLAARDKVDQFVEKLEPEQDSKTVVHLLDGDAVAFTTSYLQARLGIPATVLPDQQPTGHATPDEESDGDTEREMAPAVAVAAPAAIGSAAGTNGVSSGVSSGMSGMPSSAPADSTGE